MHTSGIDNTTGSDGDHGAAVRHLILGTAGHIDHGKTSLVRALTGTDTDRLPEEKRRGMTIELGFAELRAGEVTFGIVDVPGHEKFVRTMVAGATGIDVALIVVAADDSVMPQTIEHVEILHLLGIRHAVVAITKCDLVDDEMAALVEGEVEELLAGTTLAGAPAVRCSSTTGRGLENLMKCLVEAAGRVEEHDIDQPFRMPVDRVFSVAGRGTVVTGSVVSGCLHRGDQVEIWPVGIAARIREVQTHGHSSDTVRAGQRAAVNLQGIDKDAIERGFELAAVGSTEPTRLIDAHLSCLASHHYPLKNHCRLRLCLGTREVTARCVSLSGAPIEPGSSAFVQFRCAEPITAGFGQRFIVRDENAARTAGGGVVLRTAHRRISARMADEVAGLRSLLEDEPIDRVAEVLRTNRFDAIDEGRVALAANVSRTTVRELIEKLVAQKRLVALEGVDRPVSKVFLDAFLERALGWLKVYHRSHPEEPGSLVETFNGWLERKTERAIGKVLYKRLVDSGKVRVVGRYVCLKEFAPAMSAQDEKILATVLAALYEAAFQPPSADALAQMTETNRPRIEKLLKVASSVRQVVAVDNAIYLHADREAELRDKVRALYESKGPFSVSEMREALDSSRKYAVPIAEYLDRIGFTRRNGDSREVVPPEKT